MHPNKPIAAAMSGGVDSSVCAALLRDAGYDVHGVTFRMHRCPGTADPGEAAALVCRTLGIPHETVSAEAAFSASVMENFCREYVAGRTPNPCVVCNREIKFPFLLRYADSLGGECPAATGHYARIVRSGSRWAVAKAADAAKDQSYMLWQLPQSVLARMLFPLGTYTKPEIRQIAAERGLPGASAGDSQDICFIPDGDYTAFLQNSGLALPGGEFVDEAGNTLGRSRNQACYTVGQRRGLGIALGQYMYVRERQPDANRVVITPNDPHARSVRASSVVCMAAAPGDLDSPRRLTVKLRYARSEFACTAQMRDGVLCVTTDEAVRAPAPGQSLVLYDGDTVVAGGIIENWSAEP